MNHLNIFDWEVVGKVISDPVRERLADPVVMEKIATAALSEMVDKGLPIRSVIPEVTDYHIRFEVVLDDSSSRYFYVSVIREHF